MADSNDELFPDVKAAYSPEALAPWTVKKKYQSIFGLPAEPWHIDADFPDGYYHAAHLIVKNVVEKGRDENVPVMPAIQGIAGVALFRHYLELQLKYIAFHSRWLIDGETNAPKDAIKNIETKHSLWRFWDEIRKARVGKIPDETWNSWDTSFVERCIAEFEKVDPEPGQRFRYPVKTIGVAFPGSAPVVNRLGISFPNLLEAMPHVKGVLDAIDSYLVETHGLNKEWEEEMASW